ncbi:MAG: hypothetical protein V9E83_13665 [Baekduia sp.]
MYHFSRELYRDLRRLAYPELRSEEARVILEACETTLERVATDRNYFARPARSLFLEVRRFIPMRAQAHAFRLIASRIAQAEIWIERQPARGLDHHGRPLQCRATTRRGTACQRTPLPVNGYCPSHQHLADTEHRPVRSSVAA